MRSQLDEETSETSPLQLLSPRPKRSFLSIDEVANVCGRPLSLILIAISSLIPLIQLAIGLYYKGQCPLDQRIPTYLIVAGSSGILLVALATFLSVLFLFFVPRLTEIPRLLKSGVLLTLLLIGILSFFAFIWFIVGCVLVFSKNQQIEFLDPTKANYCNPVLYRWSYALLIIIVLWGSIQFCFNCFRQCCVGQGEP